VECAYDVTGENQEENQWLLNTITDVLVRWRGEKSNKGS